MNILLIFPGFIIAFIIVLYYELKIRRTESMNKVHFYVARDKDGTLNLWFNKPKRAVNFWYCQQKQDGWKATEEFIQNKHEIDGKQFPKLTWEDEPINVYIYSNEYSDLVESKRKFNQDKMHTLMLRVKTVLLNLELN